MEKEVQKWEDVWGGDAPYDIAGDMEETYEKSAGRSAVLWVAFDAKPKTPPSDELNGRPDEYATCGYTGEFEHWGVENSKDAIAHGCKTAEAVEEFIINKFNK